MPWEQTAVVQDANTTFNSTNINGVDETLLEPGKTLLSAAEALGIGSAYPPGQVAAAFNRWPPAVQEAIRAALYEAVTSNPRVPVQFTWVHAPGFGVLASGTSDSTMVRLRSPLP
jgi:hypothetical protein